MEFFGEFNWPKFMELVPAYIAAFSATVLLWLTFRQLKETRKDQTKRAALEFFYKVFQDPKMIEDRELFVKLTSLKTPLIEYYTNPKKRTEANAIINILNKNEYLCFGISTDSISEDIAKGYWRTTLIRDWKNLSEYVYMLREKVEARSLFEHFEATALRWINETNVE